MNLHRTETESIDLDAWRLLPWLANGTLEGDELEGVLDHLKLSPRCREELLFLSELRYAVERATEDRLDVPEDRLAGLMDRIDDHEQTRSVSPAGGAAVSRWLAQAALVVLLAGALILWVGGGTSRELPAESPPFQTLSSDGSETAAANHAPAARLRLIPEAGLAEADLRRLVLEVDAEIVGGPTAMGVYTLGWQQEGPARSATWLDGLAARLRADARVALAEPVRGP